MRHLLTVFALVFVILNSNAKNLKLGFDSDTTQISDENVDYKVSYDHNSLYLNISTTDTDKMMSMLQMGLSVFFDVKGKKKQNVYVKYPLEITRPAKQRGKDRNEERAPEEEVETVEEITNKRNQHIKNIIENELPQEGEYGYFDENEEFHILLNTVGVSLAYSFNEEEGLLEYTLTIPKNKISHDPKMDFKKLTIGVKTNEPEKKSEGERPSISMGGRGSGGQGGPPGGGGGGRQGGGGQRGGQGGPPKDAQSDKPKIETLNFWFDASM